MLQPDRPFRIIHALRTPVGGIFRHVLDLAAGQAERGHDVGIFTDSLTGGERAEAALADLVPKLKLGLHRLPIRREPHPVDPMTAMQFLKLMKVLKVNVLHGHGAKTGIFVRLKGRSQNTIRVYTPHGGSLHYKPNTLKGAFYANMEKAFKDRTDLFLFESAFARDTYERIVGKPNGLVRCVFNGVGAFEFDPVPLAADATDLVYVGEFRHIKGADLLVEAVAKLHADGRPVTLTLAGDGEETDNLKALIKRLNIEHAVRLIGHVRARHGFSKGKLLIVPSRGDSMPYVVIEAAAAGIPMLASRVGGIPEILGPFEDALFAANNPGAMADAIEAALSDLDGAGARAKSLRERIFVHFSQNAMVDGVLRAYRDAFNDR
ncbi:MAG: glycosyltransferase family 4 protein [Xanthobacteraceae bacterium]|nr:glycosyltransferase family 4 protein [Xanthobacteraceae bacterium]